MKNSTWRDYQNAGRVTKEAQLPLEGNMARAEHLVETIQAGEIATLNIGDIVWIKDPILIERLARIAGFINAGILLVNRRYNTHADKWGPAMEIPASDFIRVEARL